MSTQLSIDVAMLSELPCKALLTLAGKYKETKKYFERAQRALQDCSALFILLEEMDIDVRFDPDTKLICLNFSGDGPRLGRVWGELRRAGYDCKTRPKKGDTMFSGWFEKPDCVTFSVYFTSTMCRRVQVGTKTVEQPIYETICGNFPEVEAAPPSTPAVALATDDDIPY